MLLPSENKKLLRELLDYDPDTGVLTWRERSEDYISSKGARRTWNSRFAGKQAGQLKKDGYWRIGLTVEGIRQRVFSHRVIWVWMTGEIPDTIDHIDRNPSNNKWVNLRNVDQSANVLNRDVPIKSSSTVKGVYRNSYSKGWKVVISVKGKPLYLGSFLDFKEAVAVRKAAEVQYHSKI